MAPWPYPFWIAHRGAGRQAPENTLAAFRVGAGHGYRAFECDVKLSADGVPFLLHDATLERTTSGSGAAAALPWADLSRLDAGSWHSRAFAGEPVTSAEAVSRFCLASSHALNLELKPNPGQAHATGEAVADLAGRLWHGRSRQPLLTSFDAEALRGAREAEPDLPRGLLLDALRDGWFDEARALRCAAVVLHFSLMDAAVVDQLHAAGLRALAYTVNEPAEVDRLVAAGVDGLVTDAVDRFAPGIEGAGGSG